ncbi:type ISP restriction/modification enzyme [Streptomyces californicus]|uniref:type ISP restriction/modification enzyme n=1 Tax=Streptomyces californicus TaxID=67351 RepID=UPI0033E354D5
MGALRDYLQGMAKIHASGEAVEETSYYGQMERLLNTIGGSLPTKVICVLTTRNRGAGIPDGGLFISSRAVEKVGRDAMTARVPERGVLEVKGPGKDVRRVAASQQVRKYLGRYGKVLVTTYREFVVVSLGEDGQQIQGEKFSLAGNEKDFWLLAGASAQTVAESEIAFEDYMRRALLGDAPLSQPADLAWFLAAYAREGRKRLDAADSSHMKALAALRDALEDGLGLKFEGEEGEKFFRSALVQTLFYGVFAAWVVWSESLPPQSNQRFTWRAAQWTLKVPMVRVLFQQLATPTNLPVGLDEVLDWTEDALNRVDRALFFSNFASGRAVQYFYEPFLEAYDPDLRRQLGVWYTPPEIVRYMVKRVHQALQQDLGLPLGLADENVHVLDPCTGTGSFLVETVETIAQVLEEEHGDALVAQDAKQAALNRVYGFELLPAPFVIAHLNIGLALDRLGAPLSSDERAKVYLTNALTGWVESEEHPRLPFPEFEAERDAAIGVKRTSPILVVLGNPPYNGLASVSGKEEGGLIGAYKNGLDQWDILKNKLDDLYVRFFRVAERRITEQTGQGIVCFISNFSWLGDPSSVVMRQHMVREFDQVYIDNLNGDSRETGKKTPDGTSDPSVFSTKLNPSGIQVGTAISLLIRREQHDPKSFQGRYRDFWGPEKRSKLLASLDGEAEYTSLSPAKENWYRLRPWSPRQGYGQWPAIPDLAKLDPLLGLNENRGDALISTDRRQLLDRMAHYLDSGKGISELDERVKGLTQKWSRFDPAKVRQKLLADSPYDASKVVRFCVKPFDVRWAYVDTTAKLWNESRDELVEAATIGSDFLLLRRRAPRALDGAAFLLSRCLIDQHVMHRHAYVMPFFLAAEEEGEASDGTIAMFSLQEQEDSQQGWTPNLSQFSLDYLSQLGVSDAQTSQSSAQLIWRHVLAVGHSPLYLEENGDAIRNDWPRVPLPATFDQLADSAKLGEQVANLLDIDSNSISQGFAKDTWRRTVAQLKHLENQPISPESGDLAINVGWAIEQKRKQQSGAISRIVMPGSGRLVVRDRTTVEHESLTDGERDLLGSEVVDVFLNESVCWSGVPQAVWDFKVGGFQVLRKWLSYRDKGILGRDLTTDEVRQFTGICQRITQVVLMGPQLDENYIQVAGASAD